MLGLILIYFLGKRFYELAEEYDKNKWGFTLLGILAYYAGTFLGGLVYEIVAITFSFTSVEDMSKLQLTFIALPFGILSCYVLHYFLERSWKKEKENQVESIDDIGKS